MNPIRLVDHNWLAHKINNASLRSNAHILRGKVIDLGCGICPYKQFIREHATEYVAVDWQNSMHDQSQVDVFANLNETLPLESALADTVVSFQVMEHLAEPRTFLAECLRILKPGGGLLLTVPFMWQVHEAPHDYFRYTRYGLEYLLRQAGFVDIEVTANTGFWQTAVLKFNYYTRRFARGKLRYLFIPVWWTGQALAPHLDRLDPRDEESASYTVTARRPA